MSVNSRVLGLLVLIVIFGGVTVFSALGLWQTERGGQGQHNHGGVEGELAPTPVSLHGWGLALSLDDGIPLYVPPGSSHYAQSIGFAPLWGSARCSSAVRRLSRSSSLKTAEVVATKSGRIYTRLS